MTKAAVLHFTPSDYLSDYKTRRLDLEEHGAYMLLLWHMWHDSDCQCEFPMDALALASIWGVSPEHAMTVCESLIAPGVALVKVVERTSGTVLQSKRLREQVKAFSEMLRTKAEAGRASGKARRKKGALTSADTDEQKRTHDEQVFGSVEHVLNKSELTVFPCLGSPDVSQHVDQTPVSSRSSDSPRKERGSYPQDEKPTIAIETYIGKLGRDLTADELRSVKRWVKEFGSGNTCTGIGYAAQDGFIEDPKRVYGQIKAIAKGASS